MKIDNLKTLQKKLISIQFQLKDIQYYIEKVVEHDKSVFADLDLRPTHVDGFINGFGVDILGQSHPTVEKIDLDKL